jgi:hypothetical protein
VSELHRFADTAEAAATLALRDGRAEALGFYLDRRRVHVGDPASSIDGVFNAWQADRSQGWDSIMLAPTLSWPAASTNAPKITASPAALPAGRSSWSTAMRRVSVI